MENKFSNIYVVWSVNLQNALKSDIFIIVCIFRSKLQKMSLSGRFKIGKFLSSITCVFWKTDKLQQLLQ